jgi:hypothetical protein
VAKSTVARIERGDATVSLPVLRADLAAAELGLALADEEQSRRGRGSRGAATGRTTRDAD